MRFTVLASGSGGNASLVESPGFGILLDAGLGPRQIGMRLSQIGRSWTAVQAVLLSHTHSDHWKDATLLHLHRHKLPLWCHAGHLTMLRTYSDGFLALQEAGLVRLYEPNENFELSPQVRCRALPLRHDGGATFGFRLESSGDLLGQRDALGYVADLGCWDDELAAQLADVDLLAVEFNHDVSMQHASSRSPRLIQRILGDDGHLSNVQAVALVRAVLARSTPGRLRHLVQLHLSRDCNRPALARTAVRQLLDELGLCLAMHTAEQDAPGQTLHCNAADALMKVRRSSKRCPAGPKPIQPTLPGLLDEAEL